MLQIFAKFIAKFLLLLKNKSPFLIAESKYGYEHFFLCLCMFLSFLSHANDRLSSKPRVTGIKLYMQNSSWWRLLSNVGWLWRRVIIWEVSHLWLRLLSSIFRDLDTRQTHNHFLMCYIYVTFNGRKYRTQIKSIIYIKYSVVIISEQNIYVSTCVISVSHSMHWSTGHKSNPFSILSIHLWSL